MFFGQPSPDASTGMSSYLLKLMPVLAPPNRSLRDTGVKGSRGQGKEQNRVSELVGHFVMSIHV